MSRQEKNSQCLAVFEHYENSLHTVDEHNFEDIALSLFYLQAEKNTIYKQYITHLGINPRHIKRLEAIPFLPISFFKSQIVVSDFWQEDTTFLSSTTTSAVPGQHRVRNISFYHNVASAIFNAFYGNLSEFHFFMLFPPHSNKKTSSLASMMAHFIQKSGSDYSGFYLHNQDELHRRLAQLQEGSKKIVVWGTSFTLMDFAEHQKLNLSRCIVIETGGMKGQREEITRANLHAFLCDQWNLENVHSEYGMTELLSQAYAQKDGCFQTPSWMKVIIRDPKDPFNLYKKPESGGINIIDLANIYTCAFIETQDLGKINQNGGFEVLGRMDHSDTRGCNLLV